MRLEGSGLVAVMVFCIADAWAQDAAEPAIQETAQILAAESKVPQFTARRGGSLGIPTQSAADGVQASIDVFGSDASGNAFAKLDGVEITRTIRVDFLAESFEELIPRALLGSVPATTELVATKLAAGGLRVRASLRDVLYVRELQEPACLKAISVLTPAEFRQLARMEEGVRSGKLDAAKSACKIDELAGKAQWTGSLGLRGVTRISPEEGGANSRGYALEVALLYESDRKDYSWLWYVSPSFLYLKGDDDKAGASVARFPSVSEVRLNGGIELRGSDGTAGKHGARIGLYGNVVRNHWHNEFNFGTVESDPHGYQSELGLYVSGNQGPFSGVVSASFVNSFGGAGWDFTINFAPAATATGDTTTVPPPAPAGGGGS